MSKEEFYFDSRDGRSKIHAVKWIPNSGNVKAILVVVHGMAEYIERYSEFAKFVNESDILVTGIDNLGHGKSMKEDRNPGYFCKQDPATVVVRDVHRLKKFTQEEYPGVPVIIMGHSMGSFIVRNYLFRYGTGVDGAVIMGTGSQPGATLGAGKALCGLIGAFCGENHISKMLNSIAFGTYCKRIDSPKTEFDWLSVNEENVNRYIADPGCGFIFPVNGFKTLFELIARAQEPKNLEKIPKALPVLFVSGSEDPVGNYGKGPKEVCESYQKQGILDVSLKLYEGMRHEILNENGKVTPMTDVRDFIEKCVTRACK